PDPSRDNAFFTGRFATYIIDRVFTENGQALANDLVVPRDGVFAKNGYPLFPVQDVLRYEKDDHVWHTGFFAQPQTIAHIKRHFGIAATAARATRAAPS